MSAGYGFFHKEAEHNTIPVLIHVICIGMSQLRESITQETSSLGCHFTWMFVHRYLFTNKAVQTERQCSALFLYVE